jgi:hypothetical protein
MVKMMNKGEFENARRYATSIEGGTLSLWTGTQGNGAIVREDSPGSRQEFKHFAAPERASEYFSKREAK